jgi:hypothetical protein
LRTSFGCLTVLATVTRKLSVCRFSCASFAHRYLRLELISHSRTLRTLQTMTSCVCLVLLLLGLRKVLQALERTSITDTDSLACTRATPRPRGLCRQSTVEMDDSASARWGYNQACGPRCYGQYALTGTLPRDAPVHEILGASNAVFQLS